MRLAMESHTGGMPLCGLGAPETERVGATRSHDVEVGHTMGPPSERSHAASRNAITPRRSGLTTANRLRYPSSAEATPELFHGTRDITTPAVACNSLTHAMNLSLSHVLGVMCGVSENPGATPAFRQASDPGGACLVTRPSGRRWCGRSRENCPVQEGYLRPSSWSCRIKCSPLPSWGFGRKGSLFPPRPCSLRRTC